MPNGEAPTNDVRLKRAVTVWNDSGGVGKTTITINSAEALARGDEKVLVLDMDPQFGGLTDHAGFSAAHSHEKFNIVDVLMMPDRSLTEIVLSADDERNDLEFDLIPAHEDLEKFGRKLDNNLSMKQSRIDVLRRNIFESGLINEYDYILIDCRASRGEVVANAVAATLNVMIPTECSRKGSRSVDGLVTYVENKQREIRRADSIPDDAQTRVVSIVPNEAAKTGRLTNTEKEALEYMLSEHPPARMPGFYIPARTLIRDSWKGQRPLRQYVEWKEHRDLRPNEEILPVMFDLLADIIREGDAGKVDDSSVANIPEELYPGYDEEDAEVMEYDESEVEEETATKAGGVQ